MPTLTQPIHVSLVRVGIHKLGTAAPVTKVADTHTPVPKGHGDFNFFTFPSIGGKNVAFKGAGAAQPQNIYLSANGVLDALVQVGVPYPSSGAFTALGLPSASEQQVAFWGENPAGPGIYTARPELRTVANTRTAVPGGTGNFSTFESSLGPGVSTDQVAFVGSDEKKTPGVYVGIPAPSGVSLIANTQTSIPGGQGTFTSFSGAAISGNRTAFFGSNTGSSPIQVGIYSAQAGASVHKVADRSTAAPDGSGNFIAFTVPTVSGNAVAFTALTQSNSGVYRWDNGSLSTVANLDTSVPGGQGTFAGFNNAAPSSDGNDIAFLGIKSDGTSGIFASRSGKLVKVIDQNDSIEGQAIIYLGLDTHQLSQGVVAFYAVLANKVFGIYTIPLPNPN